MSGERIILRTPRFLVREVVSDDLDFACDVVGDAAVMRYYPIVFDRHETREWLQRQKARYAADGCGLWLVTDAESREPRGFAGLVMQTIDKVREPEIGYLMARRFWRQGIAGEVACAIRDYAFTERGHSHVISLIRPENLASQAVARKVGMTVWKQTRFADRDHLVFRIDCSS